MRESVSKSEADEKNPFEAQSDEQTNQLKDLQLCQEPSSWIDVSQVQLWCEITVQKFEKKKL